MIHLDFEFVKCYWLCVICENDMVSLTLVMYNIKFSVRSLKVK